MRQWELSLPDCTNEVFKVAERDGLIPCYLKRKGVLVIATQHGTSRASFKTWTKTGENRKLFDEEAVELCMAHKLQDDYGGAYNRATLEPERRQVMEAWGQYCFSKLKL